MNDFGAMIGVRRSDGMTNKRIRELVGTPKGVNEG